jgi:MoaA/NifB/PqqE/SkfB family radical SAM enzyme/GT2 family glycosyltransferase
MNTKSAQSLDDLRISVVVPFKDREDELDRLLQSIEGQRDGAVEVVLINDCSGGDVARFSSQADVWIENTINCGPSYSRNIGVQHSSGEVLLFLDSDVVLRPDCLVTVRKVFQERPNIHALGGSGPPNANGDDVRYIHAKHYSEEGVNTKQIITADTAPPDGLIECDHVESAFLAIRREAFLETGGFDPYWFYMGEDRDICLKLKDLGYRIYASWPTRTIHFEAGVSGRDEVAFTRFLYTRYLEVAIKRGGLAGGDAWIRANEAHEALDDVTIDQAREKAPFLAWRARQDFMDQAALDTYYTSRCREKALVPKGMGKRIDPTSLVLFVTARCNARCKHCFIDHSLTPVQDPLSLNDIERLLDGIELPLSLMITGGEPTLRSDLGEIVLYASKAKGVASLSLMTNGSKPEKLEACCRAFLENTSKPLRVQISIDGPKEVHDKRRNVVGLYDKALDTALRCKAMSEQFSHFSNVVCCTVGNDTLHSIEEFVAEMQSLAIEAKLTVARSSEQSVFNMPSGMENTYPDSTSNNVPDMEAFHALIETIKKAHPGFLNEYQETKLRVIEKTLSRKARTVPCLAGYNDVVIYDNFDIALCEHARTFGNMRDWDLDLSAAWNSREAWEHRARLTSCACIHGCNISTAISRSRQFKAGKQENR